MLKIIPGATGYFNKTLNSNQFDNEDAIKDKLDNRGTIKGKVNSIYGKSIDYAALRHRDIIIAKIDLFIQRITHNLWTAREKNVTLIKQINDLKMWVNKYIDDCTDEELDDRDFITSVVDRAIFHFAINSICNPEDTKDATPIDRYTFDVETKNGLPSTVQLFYKESKDNEPLANIHFQAIGSGFLTFVNACQEHDDNSLKLFASLLISLSYSSAYADLSETVYINENNESYLKAQFEKLSQRDMKKYLGEMKRLADGGEMNFDGYLDKMSHLVNEGTLDPDILSKMRDAAPKLIDFAKSFDPNSKEKIKILTDTSKLIYDLFGVKSEK
ncbi:TPA: DUF2713 family protein [Escherichia coli]|uniref:DUF2713 family protein n=1 Tax=Escherichia coli TaxID=562 RepID=UPI000B7CF1C5|nr:DUF2713 family protein [Escherichia coli]EKK4596315.1 DUF2713 family protein [Escherichia coli]EKY4873726.1 DUF2713 family protein [Escherichia coli]ELR8651157.1 DUF2713 family protein [Escherichia coli]MBB7984918.1 DUF2713 family protein [Escherichia coli]HBI7868658.1 DUF2713 family protein [Escherichia coli]